MSVREHAQAILDAIDSGDQSALLDFATATCDAEEAWHAEPIDGDAARYRLGMTFLKSLAVGLPAGGDHNRK